MMPRRAIRGTVATMILTPLAVGPLAVLAQATNQPASHSMISFTDTLLKIWSALSVLVIAGLHLWVRSIVRDHTDRTAQAASDALRSHDENQSAHANHKNPAKYAQEIAEVRAALNTVSTHIAVILARIESGQERNAERWESLAQRLDHLANIESRVTALESKGGR